MKAKIIINGIEQDCEYEIVKPSKLEQDLLEWVKPRFESYVDELKNCELNIHMMVMEELTRPYADKQVVDGKTFYHIGLPADEVLYAKEDGITRFELYSGNEVEMNSAVNLDYLMYHEIAHLFNQISDSDLSEAEADKIAMMRVIDKKDGQEMVSAYTSILLVQANVLGIADFKDARSIPYPVTFTDESYELIQKELDAYHKQPAKYFLRIDEELNEDTDPFANHDSAYARGFMKLQGINFINPEDN